LVWKQAPDSGQKIEEYMGLRTKKEIIITASGTINRLAIKRIDESG